jgi:hypothetical protein
MDDAWTRLWTRLQGLTDAEYLWEPVPDSWSLRGDGAVREVDWADPDLDPAPVTTIAWRVWHIGSDCLASYVSPHLGEWPLTVRGREWPADADAGLEALQRCFEVFRERIVALGDEHLWDPLGPAWGAFAESSWADLVVHALDELAHHGGEVGLLRDLYRAQS